MTQKQELFVKSYVLTKNGAESVRKAGFKCKNPSHYANELLKKPNIAQYIEEEFKRIVDTYKLSEEEIYSELGKIAKENKEKTSDRLRALELAGKALGLFKENTVNVAVFSNIEQEKVLDLKKALATEKLSTRKELTLPSNKSTTASRIKETSTVDENSPRETM